MLQPTISAPAIENISKEKIVSKIIADTFLISVDAVNEDLAYQSIPEWDSMGHINLIVALEKKLGIKIDKENVLELESVEKILSFVNKKTENLNKKTSPTKKHIFRGLNNVYFDKSSIAFVDSENAQLYYRGYLIDDLITAASYEEVAYLLMYGVPATKELLKEFTDSLYSMRALSSPLVSMIQLLAPYQSPTEMLITATTVLNNTREMPSTKDHAMMYLAKIPTLLGVYFAFKHERKWIQPTKNLSQAEYLLYALLGKVPCAETVRVFEQNMILQAEHDANASTFAARVTTSTEAGINYALVSAMSTFVGDLHGGALLGVVNMLEEIRDVTRVTEIIQKRLKEKRPIFGFGHRVYRGEDPRARVLKKNAEILSDQKRNHALLHMLEAIKGEMKSHIEHGIDVNVDFYACVSYCLMDIQKEMLLPVFMVSRLAGWLAHIMEQEKNNILIRPRLAYEGEIKSSFKSVQVMDAEENASHD